MGRFPLNLSSYSNRPIYFRPFDVLVGTSFTAYRTNTKYDTDGFQTDYRHNRVIAVIM